MREEKPEEIEEKTTVKKFDIKLIITENIMLNIL